MTLIYDLLGRLYDARAERARRKARRLQAIAEKFFLRLGVRDD